MIIRVINGFSHFDRNHQSLQSLVTIIGDLLIFEQIYVCICVFSLIGGKMEKKQRCEADLGD